MVVLLALTLQAAAAAPAPTPGSEPEPTTVTIEMGSVRARVSCEPESDRSTFCAAKHLEIFRDDQPSFQEGFLGPPAYLDGNDVHKALEVVDRDGDGDPEVLLNLYSGGAHCCFSTRIYSFTRNPPHYTALLHDWGNPGYRLEDLDHDGKLELVTGDDRFAAVFTSFAASRLPPRIFRFSAGGLEDVTRSFPAFLEKDSNEVWAAFQQLSPKDSTGNDVRGLAAAYVADEYLLGRGSEGWRRVLEAYKKPDRKKFFADLTAHLAKTGYSRPS